MIRLSFLLLLAVGNSSDYGTLDALASEVICASRGARVLIHRRIEVPRVQLLMESGLWIGFERSAISLSGRTAGTCLVAVALPVASNDQLALAVAGGLVGVEPVLDEASLILTADLRHRRAEPDRSVRAKSVLLSYILLRRYNTTPLRLHGHARAVI